MHRLVPGRRLVLGGVDIEYAQGLDGHSDADVVLHALTDAILGACGLGDIGELFPDTDDRWHAADSAVFVTEALEKAAERGFVIENVDTTILAERPRLSPYKEAIRKRLAELLDVSTGMVNIKAKTGERVGPIGRGEAIGAEAIVLLTRAE